MKRLDKWVHAVVRVNLWAAVVFIVAACGLQKTPILITLRGDLADVESVQVTPTLNGRKGEALIFDLSQGKQYVLGIPGSEGGQLQLDADVTSKRLDACKMAHRTMTFTFQPESTKPIEVTLDLAPVLCPLTVELVGLGSVTSDPPSIDCRGAVLCTGWFRRGQPVTLKTDTKPASRYREWSGACQAQGSSCAMTVVGGSKVQVRDRRGICSKDDWCWQDPLPWGNWLDHVWGSDANNLWAVGYGGTIVRWKGTAWASQNSATSTGLYGVWGSDANNLWAVGEGGTIVYWNGTAWAPQNSATVNWLRSVWGSDANNLWAVGHDGTIVHWNGTAWAPQNSGTSNGLYGVWGSDANSLWAVGEGGTIVHWNGTTWASQDSGTSNGLYGVWGSDANNLWAVGYSGTIVHWNGTTWASQNSGTSNGLYGVWGSDANNLWAVGQDGTIVHWNGAAWAPQNSGTLNGLDGVWGSDANNLWAVGQDGAILRYQP